MRGYILMQNSPGGRGRFFQIKYGLKLFSVLNQPDMGSFQIGVEPANGVDIEMNEPRGFIPFLTDLFLKTVVNKGGLVASRCGPVIMAQAVIEHGINPGFLAAPVYHPLFVNKGFEFRKSAARLLPEGPRSSKGGGGDAPQAQPPLHAGPGRLTAHGRILGAGA